MGIRNGTWNWREALVGFALLIVLVSLVVATRSLPIVNSPLTKVISQVRSEGNSEIISENYDSTGVTFTYRIGTEKNASLSSGLWVEDTVQFLNLTGMETLELTIDPESCNSFNLELYFHIPEFTIPGLWFTHRLLLTEVTVRPGVSTYRIPIREMHTPMWWYSLNRMSRSSVPEHINWHRCTGIAVSNHDLATRGEELTVRILDGRFLPNRLKTVLTALALLLTIPFLWKLFLYREKRQKLKYEPITTRSGTAVSAETLEQYLGSNYTNEGLTMERVSDATGISAAKIRTVMKELHRTTLNDYIINLRITEAARLLKESDMQIAEIARIVGYPHVSTFNHIFKRIHKQTPGAFRKR